MDQHGQHRPLVRVAALAMLLAAGSAADAACRQALALGLDVSGSVDAAEYRLQLDGLAAALTDPEVASVLLDDAAAPVRIAVYEWSGPEFQSLVLDWTALGSEAELLAAASALRRHQRSAGAELTTALGTALVTGFDLLASQGDCWKRTLDISGDGKSNAGPRPQDVADQRANDIVVNALVIGTGTSGADGQNVEGDLKELTPYFEAYVIAGDGAFAEAALGFDDYGAAMKRKLLRELQSIVIGWNSVD